MIYHLFFVFIYHRSFLDIYVENDEIMNLTCVVKGCFHELCYNNDVKKVHDL